MSDRTERLHVESRVQRGQLSTNCLSSVIPLVLPAGRAQHVCTPEPSAPDRAAVRPTYVSKASSASSDDNFNGYWLIFGEGWVVGSARLYNYIRGEPTATGPRSRAVPHTGNFRCRVYGTNTSPGLRPRPHLGVLVNPTLEHTSPTTHIASPGRAVDRPAAGGERPRIIEHVHGRLTRGLAPAAAAAATMAAAAVAALATTRGQLRPWAHSRYTPG